MLYFLFDRLSSRHNWQILGHGIGIEWRDWCKNNQIAIFEKWHKSKLFVDYQIGIVSIELDDKDNHPELFDNLPKNYNNIDIVYHAKLDNWLKDNRT